MKKKTLIIENSDREKTKKFFTKLIITITLLILCTTSIIYIIKISLINKEFAESIAEISKINSKTIFSIDRIYLYSSADAKSKETNKPNWDLDISIYRYCIIY